MLNDWIFVFLVCNINFFFLIFVFRGDLKGNSLFFMQKLDFLLKEHGGHASGKREEDSVCGVRWLAVISVFDVGISG